MRGTTAKLVKKFVEALNGELDRRAYRRTKRAWDSTPPSKRGELRVRMKETIREKNG